MKSIDKYEFLQLNKEEFLEFLGNGGYFKIPINNEDFFYISYTWVKTKDKYRVTVRQNIRFLPEGYITKDDFFTLTQKLNKNDTTR